MDAEHERWEAEREEEKLNLKLRREKALKNKLDYYLAKRKDKEEEINQEIERNKQEIEAFATDKKNEYSKIKTALVPKKHFNALQFVYTTGRYGNLK